MKNTSGLIDASPTPSLSSPAARRPLAAYALLCGMCVAMLAMVGCGNRDRTWEHRDAEAAADNADGINKSLVLFAPVALGPLAETYPEASVDYARELAKKLDLAVDDVEAFYSAELPVSDAPRWQEGLVGATAGADGVVLTQVQTVTPIKGAAGQDDLLEVMVLYQVLDAKGQLAWSKQVKDTAPDVSSVKFTAPAAQPISRASWNAISEGFKALKNYVSIWQPPSDEPDNGAIEDLPTIDIVFDSIPQQADVYVDGVFRGNTPTTIALPTVEFDVLIQRQGYQSWQATLTPSPEMRVQPALEPIP